MLPETRQGIADMASASAGGPGTRRRQLAWAAMAQDADVEAPPYPVMRAGVVDSTGDHQRCTCELADANWPVLSSYLSAEPENSKGA